MERVRKEYIRRTARAEHWDEVREARLRFFGHMQRKDNRYWAKNGQKKDMQGAGVTEAEIG